MRDFPYGFLTNQPEFVLLVRDKDREALEAFQPKVKLSTSDLLGLAELEPYEFLYIPGPGPDHIHWLPEREAYRW